MKARIHALALAAAATTATLFALAPTTLAGGSANDDTPWIADFDVAVKRAKAESKDLLVDFTGSDWCKWCIQLHDEVFSRDEFLSYATANFVLVALDYPQGDEAKARVPNPARNDELSKKFRISGFPTVLMMTAEGEVYGRTGYQPGGPVAYVEHLTELRTGGRAALTQAIELVKQFQAAEGPARRAVLVQILDVLDGLAIESPIVDRLEGPARAAFELDPENADGLKLRAVKALLSAGRNDELLMGTARELDPRNEQGVLELAVFAEFRAVEAQEDLERCCDSLDRLLAAGKFHTKDQALFMLVNAAIWNEQYLENPERAKKYAARALEFELDDEPLVKRLNEILGN